MFQILLQSWVQEKYSASEYCKISFSSYSENFKLAGEMKLDFFCYSCYDVCYDNFNIFCFEKKTLYHYNYFMPVNFENIKKLGGSNQGVVWLSKDTRLGRKVAIKSLHNHHTDNEDQKSRFIGEAKRIK